MSAKALHCDEGAGFTRPSCDGVSGALVEALEDGQQWLVRERLNARELRRTDALVGLICKRNVRSTRWTIVAITLPSRRFALTSGNVPATGREGG